VNVSEIVETARHVACDGSCGAHPDHDCTCAPGVHASRVYHAGRAGLIDADDVAYVIRNYVSVVAA